MRVVVLPAGAVSVMRPVLFRVDRSPARFTPKLSRLSGAVLLIVPALLTVLVPLTRTSAKLGLAPAPVCCGPMVAPDWMLTVRLLTPVAATKPFGCAPVQVTVCPAAGVAG